MFVLKQIDFIDSASVISLLQKKKNPLEAGRHDIQGIK